MWDDFDFEERTVQLLRSLQRIKRKDDKKSHLELVDTKTEESDRTVRVPQIGIQLPGSDIVILRVMSVLYSNSGSVPLASKLSFTARKKMFDLFLHHFKPDRSTTVLDVGVTSDSTFRESNYFEQFYPYPQNITCVGTENGSYLVEKYAGLRFQQVRAGESLPFRDSEFDIVFSNAVVEHVGNRHQQAQFMNELCRVARAFFVTTPNRWFPVEHHTGLPLLHYLPGPLFRSLIHGTRYDYWASEEHLNILTGRELSKILPRAASVRVERIRLFGIVSNLVAIGRRH